MLASSEVMSLCLPWYLQTVYQIQFRSGVDKILAIWIMEIYRF